MKILICVPCMDQVAAQFAQSLAMLRKDEEETSLLRSDRTQRRGHGFLLEGPPVR